MFAAPFGRILWKEYRVHRALWLFCLLIGILSQLAVPLLGLNLDLRKTVLYSYCLIFTFLYAIGCGALLFAIEREERTCDWLLSLSAPPGPTLIAKILFAVFSTVALQLAFTVSSSILNAGHREFMFTIRDIAGGFFPFVLLALVWSMLGSLVSRRVMVSIAVMCFAFVVTFVIPLAFVIWLYSHSNLNGQWFIYLPIALIVANVMADVWLGWRWCQGRYLDGSVFEHLEARFQQWCGQVTSRTTPRSRLPARTEYEQSWRRTLQRLIWHERQRDSLHRQLLLAGFAFGILPVILISRMTSWLLLIPAALSLVLPLAMGIIGFGLDANLQQTRFLCNRGIAPSGVWLAKQIVWMTRAFWITSVVLFANACIASALYSKVLPEDEKTMQQMFGVIPNRPELAIWYVLMSYGCGQLVSSVFKGAVIASIFGIIINIAAAYWLHGMVILAVPLWWSQGFPVIAMLIITLWQMKARMLEDHSWLRRIKLASTVVATVAVLMLGFTWHRVAEVAALPGLDPQMNEAWKTALTEQQKSQTLSTDEEFVRSRMDVLSQSSLEKNAKADEINAKADEIVELMKRDLHRLDHQFRPRLASELPSVTSILRRRADEYCRDQRLDKALECYLTGLKYARLFAAHGQLSVMWQTGNESQYEILENAVHWANDPSQTPESIRNAIKTIESELAKFPSATEAIAASYINDRRIIDDPSPAAVQVYLTREKRFSNLSRSELRRLEQRFRYRTRKLSLYQHHYHLVDHSSDELSRLTAQPWERMRLRILITREAEFLFSEITVLESKLAVKPAVVYAIAMPIPVSDTPAKATTNPLLGLAVSSLKNVKEIVLRRKTEIRAALTRMELIAYRLDHGKLPDRLIELMATIDGLHLVDPCSDRFFDYYPTFLLSAGDTDAALLPVSSTGVGIYDDRLSGCIGTWKFNDVASGSFPFGQSMAATFDVSLQRRLQPQDDSAQPSETSVFPIPLKH